MATLYTTGTVLAAAVDVLPQWPGVDRRLVLSLTLAGALAAFVTGRLRALPLPFAAALTVCGNSLIAAAQAGGGTGTGALASVYALSLTVAFLMYPTPLLVAQIAYATAAETVVLVLLRGEGASALVTVVVTIGSACSAGVVVRKLADLRADAELELAWRAAHDALTGLANRVALTRAWAALPTAPGTTVGVLVLDLRGFKQVNDVLGHHYGDALLVEVGARLHGLAGEGLACRLGGDEFGVLLPGVDTGTARRRADAVVAALQEPYRVNDVEIPLGVTVGVAVHTWRAEHAEPDDDTSLRALSALLAEADAAMYYARELRAAVACSDDLRATGGGLPRPRAGLPGAPGGVTGSGVTGDASDTDDHRSGAASV